MEDSTPYETAFPPSPSEARPQPPATGDRDYLRSVVEQIHRDAHDALEYTGETGSEGVTVVSESPETPGGEPLCETCGYPETDLLHEEDCGGPGECAAEHPDEPHGYHPFRARPQEVDEGTEWRRHSETGELEGLPVATWILDTPEWTHVRHVPLTLEQAIASRAAAEARESVLEHTAVEVKRFEARAERAERASAEAEARAVEWEKAYRDRTAELTGAEEERDRLRAALESVEADAGMVKVMLHEVATDPEAWIDMVIDTARRALRESSEASQGER